MEKPYVIFYVWIIVTYPSPFLHRFRDIADIGPVLALERGTYI